LGRSSRENMRPQAGVGKLKHALPTTCHFSVRIASGTIGERIAVPDWLQIILVMAAYIVLMRWVLPRLGVGT